MALRVLKPGERADVVAANAELLNNFNTQEAVRFPDAAVEAADDSIISSEEFQSLARDVKRIVRPVLVNMACSAIPVKALAIDGKFVLINSFVEDAANARFPMFSPHRNHIYLDMTDFTTANIHRNYRELLANF